MIDSMRAKDASWPHSILVPTLFLYYGICVMHLATLYSPNFDEVGHLAAGASVWDLGRFDLYRVNPPLVKSVSALPCVLGGANFNWSSFLLSDFGRPEYKVGHDFIEANKDQWFVWYVAARWATIPFLFLGAYSCYSWANSLYGGSSGVVALMMWVFSPSIVYWSTSFTPDMVAASLGCLSCWRFWKWVKNPSFINVLVAGFALGVSQLAKMSLVIMYLALPLSWFVYVLCNSCKSRPQGPGGQYVHKEAGVSILVGQFMQIIVIMIVSFYVVNAGYGFNGSCQEIGDFKFGCSLLAGDDAIVCGKNGGNRFLGTIVSSFPVPFPNKWWVFETHGTWLPILPWHRVPFVSWLPDPLHAKIAKARIYTKRRIVKLLSQVGFRVTDVVYVTAPMDRLTFRPLQQIVRKTIFHRNTTRIPILATSIMAFASKD